MKTIILFTSLMFGLVPNSIEAFNSTVHNHYAESVQQNEATVYVTKTGTKFHKSSCFHVKGRQPSSMSRTKAVQKGYEACKHCKP